MERTCSYWLHMGSWSGKQQPDTGVGLITEPPELCPLQLTFTNQGELNLAPWLQLHPPGAQQGPLPAQGAASWRQRFAWFDSGSSAPTAPLSHPYPSDPSSWPPEAAS